MRKKFEWAPGASDYLQVFTEQNPWWTGNSVPDTLAKAVERPFAAGLLNRLLHDQPRRYQLILGPRRVGKTTCMYQAVKGLLAAGIPPEKIHWIRLDHPLLMEISLGELVRQLVKPDLAKPQSGETFVFLDEITYAKDWDKWLKTFYDDHWPIRLAGTSSSTAALRSHRMESGVGRWEEQYLSPYLFSEYLSLLKISAPLVPRATLSETLAPENLQLSLSAQLAPLRHRYMLTGGFPELLLGQAMSLEQSENILQSQRTLRSDAVERAVYKDIPQVFRVDNPPLLERLLYTLAGQITGVLSPNKIGASLNLSQTTFDRYLSYLEQSYLVFTLQNYSGREASKQSRGRKLYFVDGAVRNAALQRGVMPLSSPEEMGLLLENLVAGQLHALGKQTQTRLYYWRDGNNEVDFIYDHPSAPLAFEIGSSRSHHRAGLESFLNRYPKFHGNAYLVAPDAPLMAPSSASGIGSMPLDLLLLAVGRQTEHALGSNLQMA